MLNIGPQELLIILVIALIVVGPQRLPALGRSIGRGLRELRKAQDEVKRTIQVNLDDEPPNGRSGARPTGSVRPTSSADGRAADPITTAGAASDPTPPTHEPLPADEIREISRSLGRSLAELRRAKDEVQRSFRIDVAPSTKPPDSKRRQPQPTPSTAPADAGGPSTTPSSSPAASTPDPAPDARSATPDRPTD
ncbi:MAG TPA: twin-arginine translocase TatA/TatE family subunit [Actinomycetota bacterium]|nr:twin-arginine translocase TatA/TatE family subunit [Actinomycetota bacterium]